jgi:hypothetical protein
MPPLYLVHPLSLPSPAPKATVPSAVVVIFVLIAVVVVHLVLKVVTAALLLVAEVGLGLGGLAAAPVALLAKRSICSMSTYASIAARSFTFFTMRVRTQNQHQCQPR